MTEKTPKPKKPEQIKKEQLEKEEKDKKVQIAVRFLMNPDVGSASEETKRNFLKKKGLNDDDIDKAYQLMKDKELKAAELIKTPPANQGSVQGVISTIKSSSLSPDDLLQKLEKAKTSNIIILRNLHITTLPVNLFEASQLQVLILSFNPLVTIPDEIKSLLNLKVLHAVACNLQNHQISESLWELPKLQELNLARNELVYMDDVCGLKELRLLDLSHNSIMVVPPKISELTELLLLNLGNNNISRLPTQIISLSKLRKLVYQRKIFKMLNDNLLDVRFNSILREKCNQPMELLRELQLDDDQ